MRKASGQISHDLINNVEMDIEGCKARDHILKSKLTSANAGKGVDDQYFVATLREQH